MSTITRSRVLVRGGLLAGACAAAALFVAPSAFANEDPALNPPNCSAADLEGVRAGVSASTSAYLFSHPDYNWFMTSLEGLPREEASKQTAAYLNQHPDTKNEITAIRQPLVDIRDRCAAPPSP
jgi:heme-binding protein